MFQVISLLSMFTLADTTMPVQTVPIVDLKRYAGRWYEIASFPQRFQKGCKCTTADYTMTDRGYVVVENRCVRDSTKKSSYIKGKAFVVAKSGNAKLLVQFFWPFRGKYWIIDLADDYSYAVVAHPNKKYLWILSRSPQMNESLYANIISKLKSKGFDVSRIRITEQLNCREETEKRI